MRLLLLSFGLVCMLLAACQSRPDYVIEEEKMTELLTDVHMAEGLLDVQYRQALSDPTYGQQVIAAVLEKHNISKATYDTSLVWYSQHLNSLIRIYRHVDERLDERLEQYQELVNQSHDFGSYASGDSVNLWARKPYLLMDSGRLTHCNRWSLTTDTTFYAGDTILFRVHVPDMMPGMGIAASLCLLKSEKVTSDVSVLSGQSTVVLSRDTLVTLTCAPAPDAEISRVEATLNLVRTDSLQAPLLPCIVDGIQMLRIHRKN